MRRRPLLLAAPAWALTRPALALPPRQLEFPRDHGAHPDFRTEWWYITGDARAGEREFGFQVTFFRTRIDAAQSIDSRFAAKQVVFAHAALTDVQGRKLWQDQRVLREGFEVALAAEGDTRIRLRDWSLARQGNAYRSQIQAAEFTLDFSCTPTQPVLLQGQQGLWGRGMHSGAPGYYYSLPQLALRGTFGLRGQRFDVAGKAWLDHEWSQELLPPEAVGWDWIGMNLDDGSALMAFRLRRQDGSALWDGGSFRHPAAPLYTFKPGEVVFTPQRRWTSPVSQASYPVEWIVRTPADFYTVRAVIDNQELDSRASIGAIYWEGLSDLIDSNGKPVGRGYLEMTGYAKPLKL